MEINERGFSNKALEDFDLIDRAVMEKDQQAYATLMKRYKKATSCLYQFFIWPSQRQNIIMHKLISWLKHGSQSRLDGMLTCKGFGLFIALSILSLKFNFQLL